MCHKITFDITLLMHTTTLHQSFATKAGSYGLSENPAAIAFAYFKVSLLHLLSIEADKPSSSVATLTLRSVLSLTASRLNASEYCDLLPTFLG